VLLSAVPQLSERLPEYHIRRAWAALVGPDMARRTRPQSLANGCLHVVVDNSPWLHELTLRAAELTARLSAESPAVRSLRFTLGALETEPRLRPERRERRVAALTDDDRRDIDEAASAISDPALADVARRLLTTARRFPMGARGGAR
jgi:predicted nucleic acid-binding Zn ribbon protein